MTEVDLSWDTIVRKAKSVFPAGDVEEILATLWEEHFDGGNRTRLAIIKLCDEGKGLADLSHYVRTAKLDYRDVLAWAEYPHECALTIPASDSDRSKARALDGEQYLRWLERDLREKG